MRNKLLTAAAVAVLVAAAAFLVLSPDDQEDPASKAVATPSSSSSPAASAEGPTGEPDRLVIDALDIDASVTSVGTTPANAQEVPGSLDETGWWRDGSVPGAPGNAVIVGHTASSDDGVFDPLIDIESGDKVLVSGADGEMTFAVDRTEVVPVEDFAAAAPEVYRAKGESGLVLMTCGDWNGEEFETTVIVHAVPVSARG